MLRSRRAGAARRVVRPQRRLLYRTGAGRARAGLRLPPRRSRRRSSGRPSRAVGSTSSPGPFAASRWGAGLVAIGCAAARPRRVLAAQRGSRSPARRRQAPLRRVTAQLCGPSTCPSTGLARSRDRGARLFGPPDRRRPRLAGIALALLVVAHRRRPSSAAAPGTGAGPPAASPPWAWLGLCAALSLQLVPAGPVASARPPSGRRARREVGATVRDHAVRGGHPAVDPSPALHGLAVDGLAQDVLVVFARATGSTPSMIPRRPTCHGGPARRRRLPGRGRPRRAAPARLPLFAATLASHATLQSGLRIDSQPAPTTHDQRPPLSAAPSRSGLRRSASTPPTPAVAGGRVLLLLPGSRPVRLATRARLHWPRFPPITWTLQRLIPPGLPGHGRDRPRLLAPAGTPRRPWCLEELGDAPSSGPAASAPTPQRPGGTRTTSAGSTRVLQYTLEALLSWVVLLKDDDLVVVISRPSRSRGHRPDAPQVPDLPLPPTRRARPLAAGTGVRLLPSRTGPGGRWRPSGTVLSLHTTSAPCAAAAAVSAVPERPCLLGPGPGREIRHVRLPTGPGRRRRASLHSGVSRGPETLVLRGELPKAREECARRSRTGLPGPVNTATSASGVGTDRRPPRRRSLLHPHQTAYVVPVDAVVPVPTTSRPARRSRRHVETRSTRCGLPSSLCDGSRSRRRWSFARRPAAARFPCPTRTVDPTRAGGRAARSESPSRRVRHRRRDLVVPPRDRGGAAAVARRSAAGPVLELSWYATRVTLPLGGAFHSLRLPCAPARSARGAGRRVSRTTRPARARPVRPADPPSRLPPGLVVRDRPA